MLLIAWKENMEIMNWIGVAISWPLLQVALRWAMEFSVSILYFLNYLIQFPDFGFSSVFFHSNVLKKIDMNQKSDSVSFQLAFTCSKSAIETLKKGVKYVQS